MDNLPDANGSHQDKGETTTATDSEAPSNGQKAFEVLKDYLREDGWLPQQIEDQPLLRFYVPGEHGDLRCYARIHVDLEQFLFYAIAPIKAPESMRDAVAEYITRANYGLRIGNFELDYSDGEIRYKSSIDFEDEALTPNLIRNAVYPAIHTMDFYLPGLLAVMYGSKTPEVAIQEIEQSDEDA